jgi:hypothetical protein
MLKAVLGVALGYIAMAIIVTLLCLGGFVALGVDRFFQPDSYEVSRLWLGVSVLISICSAVLGGYLCAAISRRMGACKVLALIVFALGILFCLPKMREDTNWRAGEVPAWQVMNLAQMPAWMYIVTPVVGAIGVLLGARIKLKV